MNILTKTTNAVKAKSPTIFMAAGAILSAGAIILGVTARPKYDETMKDFKGTKSAIELHMRSEGVTEEDMILYKKDMAKLYLSTGLKVTRIFGLTAITELLAIGCMYKSDRTWHSRNIELSAGIVSMANAFAIYRDKLVRKYGAEVDEEFMYGTTMETVTKTVEDENGEKKKVKEKTKYIYDTKDVNVRFFDRLCPDFRPYDMEWNKGFIKDQVKLMNTAKDCGRGYFWLNEEFEILKIPSEKWSVTGNCLGVLDGPVEIEVEEVMKPTVEGLDFETAYLEWIKDCNLEDTPRNKKEFKNDIFFEPALLLKFKNVYDIREDIIERGLILP